MRINPGVADAVAYAPNPSGSHVYFFRPAVQRFRPVLQRFRPVLQRFRPVLQLFRPAVS